MSAEYIMAAGNENVILCERGVRTFETYTRNTLDVSAIPAIKRMSHLPVIVDPSHAAGMSWMVEPLAMAAIAAGADGLIIDDFLANRSALQGLIKLVRDAGATMVGAGIAVEKAFQPGGQMIRDMGVRVESLARVKSMSEEDGVEFC